LRLRRFESYPLHQLQGRLEGQRNVR